MQAGYRRRERWERRMLGTFEVRSRSFRPPDSGIDQSSSR